MLTEIFLTFSVTSFIGCFLASLRMLYRSKCKSFKCWGFEVIRDTEAEIEYDENELQTKNQGTKSPEPRVCGWPAGAAEEKGAEENL